MLFTFYSFGYCLFLFLLIGNNRNKRYLYLLMSLPILVFVHSFIDTNTISDLPVYKEAFQDVSSLNVFNLNDISIFNFYYKFEYGFIILLKIVGILTSDFNVFLCICSCLLLGMYSMISLRYSPNVCISILVLLVVFFNQSIFVLRQHLSIAVILLSIPAVIERKLLKFVVIMAIAFLLHKSSLIWGIIYIYYGVEKKWKLILSLGVVTIVLSLIFSNLSFLNNQLSLGYASYIDGDKTGRSNLVSFFVSLSMLIPYVAVVKEKIWTDGIYKLCTLSLFILVVMSFIGINIGILSRFSLVFETSLLFIIPIVYETLDNLVVRLSYLVFSVGVYAYITYFGSFSKNMLKVQLEIPDMVQLLWYIGLMIIVFIVLRKSYNNESTLRF